MPQPTAGDVHVNAPLTNMSLAFLQNQANFIARKVFPTLPVKKQSDRYYKYDKKQWFRSDAKIRAPGARSAGTGFTVDNTPNYFCDVWAVHKHVDDQLRANADQVINPDRDATELVSRHIVLRQELEWRAKYFTTGVWTGSTTGTDVTPTDLWTDYDASTPIKDIRAECRSIQKKTGFWPNKAVIAPNVWDTLADHPDFLERIKYTQKGIVSPDLLAGVLDLGEILIGQAIEDTNDEGATEDLDFVFGSSVLLVYSAPRPSLLHPSGGYTFAWQGLFGSNAEGVRIKRFREEPRASDCIEAESAYDQKLVAPECGAFLLNVV